MRLSRIYWPRRKQSPPGSEAQKIALRNRLRLEITPSAAMRYLVEQPRPAYNAAKDSHEKKKAESLLKPAHDWDGAAGPMGSSSRDRLQRPALILFATKVPNGH